MPARTHGWFTHECRSPEITEITIQFHKDLFDDKLLRKNQSGILTEGRKISQDTIPFDQ